METVLNHAFLWLTLISNTFWKLFGMDVVLKLRIALDNGSILFGPGSEELFTLISETGSVSQAARKMGWHQVTNTVWTRFCRILLRKTPFQSCGAGSMQRRGASCSSMTRCSMNFWDMTAMAILSISLNCWIWAIRWAPRTERRRSMNTISWMVGRNRKRRWHSWRITFWCIFRKDCVLFPGCLSPKSGVY